MNRNLKGAAITAAAIGAAVLLLPADAPLAPMRVEVRVECDEMMTNAGPMHYVYLESSTNLVNWTRIRTTTNAHDPRWTTQKFGTVRTFSWLVTNGQYCFFRVGGVGW